MARLDVKGQNLIKGVHLEGLRVIGDPQEFARKYYDAGIDEIIYMDTVASLYGRNHLGDIVEHTARDIFVPIVVGGGIRSVEAATEILRQGADRVAVNTAAIKRPELISEIAKRFGSQCMVLSIEANRRTDGQGWTCFTDNGREPAHLDVIEWARQGEALGAGEILLTSINQEGTAEGFDVELLSVVCEAVSIPVVASGGMGCMDDFVEAVEPGGASAVAMAHVLHYGKLTVQDVRAAALEKGIGVRAV